MTTYLGLPMDYPIIEQEMHKALEKQQFSLNYQPICYLTTKKMAHMEVLIRWNHPELGRVSPDIFIPLAEKNGEIHLLGQWIFKTACRQIHEWRLKGHDHFKLAINISPQQILHHDFLSFIKKTLAEFNVATRYIELELTETAMIPQSVYSDRVLHQLCELGFELVMDDFGTGFSSLSHLKNLPLHTIKIDKSFLQNILEDKKSPIITTALIRLGQDLGLNVIAEGIENEAQMDFLIKNNCLLGQGHFFSGPLTSEEMVAWLE